MIINNKEYYEVFTNTIGSELIEFYYNHEFGFIGFKDMSTNDIYGFERFE